MADGGSLLIVNDGFDHEEDLDDGGYMGLWYIGSTCGKQIPDKFRH